MKHDFPVSLPEEQGIPSKAIHATLSFLRQRGVAMHSFLLARHGFLVCEAYYAPYRADTLHRMFSETKSFTSLAIGLLCDEGRLSLSDRIVDYFPEKLPPQGPSHELARLTIRDMLRMATPYNRTTYKDVHLDDWVKTFFVAPASHLPGTCFCYDTSSSHTLAALAEKLSGMPLLDYLRVKCLDEIGFSKEAYCLKGPDGVSWGGAGLMATPRDMLRVLSLVANEGVFQGRQLLPSWYLKEATAKQIDTEASASDGECDHQQGYGYQFWRTRFGGWCMFGMGGQLALCLPEQDLLVVTTADTQGRQGGSQLILDALWEHLLPHLTDTPLVPVSSEQAALRGFADTLALDAVQGSLHSPCEAGVCGRTYRFASNRLGLDALRLELSGDHGSLRLQYGTDAVELGFGLGKNRSGRFAGGPAGAALDIWRDNDAARLFQDEPANPCAASAAWKDDRTLLIRVQLLGARLGSILIQLTFQEDEITILARCFEEMGYPGFDGIASGRAEHSSEEDHL